LARDREHVDPMRILIVDDEEVLRDVLDAVLRREGF
jgi:DNA-binding response OmpR family regulator